MRNMKRTICLLIVLMLCFSLACPAFANGTNGEYMSSPGIDTDCEHHNTKLVGQKDPSCISDGFTGDLICSDCGKVIEEGTSIPKAPHNFVDGICTVCGADANNPATGDNNFVFVWATVMGVAVAGLVGVAVVYRKRYAR